MPKPIQHFRRLIGWLLLAVVLVVVPKYFSSHPGTGVAVITLWLLALSCAMAVVELGRLAWNLAKSYVPGFKERTFAFGLGLGSIACLYIAVANGVRIRSALDSGTVECAYRHCSGIYQLSIDPENYWSSIGFLGMLEAVFVVLSIVLLWVTVLAFKRGWQGSNQQPKQMP